MAFTKKNVWFGTSVVGSILSKVRLVAAVIALAFMLPSCSVTKYLHPEKDGVWLVKNQIEFDNPGDKLKNKSALSEQLAQRFQQRPNKKLFFVPRPYFYFISMDSVDKSRFGIKSDNAMRKILGEKPIFIDTTLAARTAELMATRLQNKGYFKGEVGYYITTNKAKSKGKVNYVVKPNGLYTIDTLMYQSKDTAVLRIVEGIAENSFLKKGGPIDIELYEKEVSRITNHLINNGYANFYPQFINSLEAIDSSNSDRNAKLILEILTPAKRDNHLRYTIGDIFVYPDHNPNISPSPPIDTIVNGIHFSSGGKKFRVRPRSITNSISLKKGDVYKYDNVESTRRQIGALGVFTTPTLRIEEDSMDASVLHFKIFLTPNKKWEIEPSGDVSYTERTRPGITSPNLIGTTGNITFRNRNMFRGAELFVVGLDLGMELAPFDRRDTLINSFDIKVQTELYFPRFVEYPKVWKGLSKLTGNKDFYEKLKKNGISRVSAGYNWLNLINNYDLNFFNLSFGHEIKLSRTKRIVANQAGIDVLIPKIDPGSAFENLLDDQPFLARSFSKQFMTGFIFRDVTFIYDQSQLGKRHYWYFSGSLDVSGLEIMGLNWLHNKISKNNTVWNIGGVDFSQYFRLELDTRSYWQFNRNQSFVARLNSGIERPFFNSTDVPYVKQFFVGTPNTIRGWYARGIGPGSFQEPLTNNNRNRNRFYQAADLKLVLNLEYRSFIKRLFGVTNMDGALFLDLGNIWTLDYDTARVGSQFSFKTEKRDGEIIRTNFLKSIAVAMGVGLRFDVSYFVFRLDLGTPLRFPYPLENGSQWVDFGQWRLNDIALSLGLGYPF